MQSAMLAACCLLLVLGHSAALLQLSPRGFLRLPGRSNRFGINLGSADRVAFDPAEGLVYIIGSRQDVLHVVDLTNDTDPVVLMTHEFNVNADGIPLDVSVCRGGQVGLLAISFANRAATLPGHIQLFNPVTRSSLSLDLLNEIAVDSDPKSLQWDSTCQRMVLASEGLPGKLNDVFVDPEGVVDLIIISPTGSVGRIRMDFERSNLNAVRQVFNDPDDPNYSILQDLEPENVAISDDNQVYVTLMENNAMATFSLDTPSSPVLHYLGTKDWNQYDVDTSATDALLSPDADGVRLIRRNVRSLYQSSDVDAFTFNNQTYLITADTGGSKRYTTGVQGKNFNEAITARSISTGDLNMDADTVARFRNTSEMGNLMVSNLRQQSDGWDTLFGGYNNLVMYGGRGWSLWRASDMAHVYDSGSDLEYYAQSPPYRNVFNGDAENNNLAPPSSKDARSDNMGPEPTVVAVTAVNGTQVVVVGSGRTGLLYVYKLNDINGEPSPEFQSVVRTGLTSDTWQNLYNNNQCGTPYIKDLMLVEHEDHTNILVIGSRMGALQVFTLEDV